MYMTYADAFRPLDKQRVIFYEVALLLFGSLFIALTAQISFNIGPVPITGQTLGVLLVGMLYGSKRGAATLLTYLIEGAVGLPVFAGGTFGVAVLAGPTGGYLAGFIVAAFVVGWLAERGWDRSFGLTAVAMLIVGPIIFQLADPTNAEVSVFTQTMDQLLPTPLPFIGTLIGVAVLLSASAASAQGLQNLFVGLRFRHYLPKFMGKRNQFGVADKPVWLEVGLAILCFIAFGTHEETYLAIYAAGVFILLSMTGWAASKRLLRQLRQTFSAGQTAVLLGTILASILTTGATFIIFEERFFEGAWTYLLFLPLLYIVFSYFRTHLGEPTAIEERLGHLIAGGSALATPDMGQGLNEVRPPRHILVPLDGSPLAEAVLPVADTFAKLFKTPLTFFSVAEPSQKMYLEGLATRWQNGANSIQTECQPGPVAATIQQTAATNNVDLIIMSTHGRSGVKRLLLGSVAGQLVQQLTRPVLLLRGGEETAVSTQFNKILVTLDGSKYAERVLPYMLPIAQKFSSQLLLLSVPQPNSQETLGLQMQHYLESMVEFCGKQGVVAQAHYIGHDPANTVIQVSQTENVDLIMLATHGRGGWQRLLLGSVADDVVRQASCPVFLVPIQEKRPLRR